MAKSVGKRGERTVALSALGASKGGAARAESMTPAARRAVAQRAAAARWNVPSVTHEGTVAIGGVEMPCANLDNGKRVLTAAGLGLAFGSSKKSPNRRPPPEFGNLPVFLAYGAIYKHVSPELYRAFSSPLKVRQPSGRTAFAYEAERLPEICEAILAAEKAGDLRGGTRLGVAAVTLYRGLARVGIIALVDEATGYQADRARDALATILESYIAKDLRKWVKTFPAEFYEQIFRLNGWPYTPTSVKRPGVIAHYTKDVVYARLAPGVLEELKRVTPRNDAGKPKVKLFQSLTEDLGHPRLREHLSAVVALMKISKNWASFTRHIDAVFPRFGDTIPMFLSSTEDD